MRSAFFSGAYWLQIATVEHLSVLSPAPPLSAAFTATIHQSTLSMPIAGICSYSQVFCPIGTTPSLGPHGNTYLPRNQGTQLRIGLHADQLYLSSETHMSWQRHSCC